MYQIVCPIGNFHPGYENSNYLSYLSDESFVSNPYNLLCLLEDVAGKKGLLDLTSITKIEVIENHTDQQMTLTDLEVVEAKITSIIETKYKYHDHAMALLIKYQ